jgi:hypothetical protein
MFKRVWNICETFVLLSEMNAPNESQTAVKRNRFKRYAKRQNLYQTNLVSNGGETKIVWNENENEIFIKRTSFQMKYSWNERRFKWNLRSLRMRYFCILSIHLILWSTCREEAEQASFAFWIRSLSVSAWVNMARRTFLAILAGIQCLNTLQL